MSRNLGTTGCVFCSSKVSLDEAPRLITREEAGVYYETSRDGFGYAGGIFANATCTVCAAKYLAWIDLSKCLGYGRYKNMHQDSERGFFDLSHRAAFNDEPSEEDLPDYDIREVALTQEQCSRLEAFSGTIIRRSPWPRCENTGRKIYSVYGCTCKEHRR